MSDKLLKEINSKINEKGYPTKNNFWGFNNSISRNKHGEDYVEILCKGTGAIADYIIDLALNQKLKDNASYCDEGDGKARPFDSSKDYIEIDWRILPNLIDEPERGVVIRTRLIARRYPIYYEMSGFGLGGEGSPFSLSSGGVYKGIFSHER